MKDFFRLLLHYVAPYKRYLFGSLLFNLLSAVLNVFSFLSLMPMLKILFRLDTTRYTFIPWDTPDTSFKDILLNNLYYYTTAQPSHEPINISYFTQEKHASDSTHVTSTS